VKIFFLEFVLFSIIVGLIRKRSFLIIKNYTALKKFTQHFLGGLFLLLCTSTFSQQRFANPDLQKPSRVDRTTTQPQRNCPTFELMEQVFQNDPAARARYTQVQQLLEQQQRTNPQLRTQAIITVPVVVHILLPNAQQALVTDAIVQNQLDTLNRFYGAAPIDTDSLRVYDPFRTTYGRSEIRFCLAQRTPLDLPTTGINRIVTSTIFDGTNNPGAVVSWDPTKYLNIWVVNGGNSGLLGYSYTPGTWPPSDNHQGFVNDYRAFGAGPGTGSGGYHFNDYNGGKTAVHEIGHYFNLAHTWGPNNSGNPTCTLSDFCSDTPPTSQPFFGCPNTTPVLDPCSPAPPGIMWQNHMDYADDRCMILFTAQQCARMMTAITTAPDRIGLTTSNACTAPPPAAGNDARISAIIAPINNSSTGCSSVTPVVTIQNMGSNTLTSATINVRLNGGGPITTAWTGSLAQGASANVTLANLAIVSGSNTLKVHTTLPNGLVDANPSNDTATSVFTRVAQATLPLSHNFETEFLPTGWTLQNPNADVTWGWFSPGAGGSTAGTAIDNYQYDFRGLGRYDDIVTRVISTTGLLANDSLLVNFDLAHKNYPDPGFDDTLRVMVSNNCGLTYTTIWERIGAQLATAGSTTGFYTTPAAADWKNQRASIGQSMFGAGQVQVMFRNGNGFGNVVWLDNINVSLKPRKDLQALTINRPNVTECGNSFIPSLTVRNNGGEIVTAFKTGYILDNGAPVIQSHNISLAAGGGTTTVTFPSLTVSAGTHTIKLFTAEPLTANPGPDGTMSNDTLTRTFTVPTTVANITEGFEGTFIPTNWFLINANNDLTWIKASPGRNSASAAFIDNWSTNTTGRIDIMQTPTINTNSADSLVISFDLAHKNYPGALDRLRVLVSNDCGVTFTSVYSKSGSTLATAGSSEDNYLTPLSTDWRTERISVAPALLGTTTIVRFENLSDWGNNVFIDNVNIAPKFKRDLEVRNISPQVYCGTAITPVATIFNRGTETVTAYTVAYSIDGTTAVTTNVTTAIAPGATANVTLTGATTTGGVHSVKAYSYGPVAASGTGDQYVANDTIIRPLTVVGTLVAPQLTQNFEGATFPPTGWGITNNDGDITWQRASTGNGSNGSAYVRNFAYPAFNQVDRLHSPILSYTGVDSVKLTFDVSAATRVYPGTTAIQVDTLAVLVTKDCGNTFTTVYKKWGIALQTLQDPNYPQTMEFIPGSPFYWRNESVDLTSIGVPDGPLQVIFQNTSNFGNNVYVDNINLATRTLPANLKADGYVIYPSPFSDQFSIWHVETPSDLRYVGVYTSSGQLVWKKEFNNNAQKQIQVDLSKHANGVYVVKMGYSGREVQVRIVKAN
jgi:hypothetical protein